VSPLRRRRLPFWRRLGAPLPAARLVAVALASAVLAAISSLGGIPLWYAVPASAAACILIAVLQGQARDRRIERRSLSMERRPTMGRRAQEAARWDPLVESVKVLDGHTLVDGSRRQLPHDGWA